jgi:hypothetical protein
MRCAKMLRCFYSDDDLILFFAFVYIFFDCVFEGASAFVYVVDYFVKAAAEFGLFVFVGNSAVHGAARSLLMLAGSE